MLFGFHSFQNLPNRKLIDVTCQISSTSVAISYHETLRNSTNRATAYLLYIRHNHRHKSRPVRRPFLCLLQTAQGCRGPILTRAPWWLNRYYNTCSVKKRLHGVPNTGFNHSNIYKDQYTCSKKDQRLPLQKDHSAVTLDSTKKVQCGNTGSCSNSVQ